MSPPDASACRTDTCWSSVAKFHVPIPGTSLYSSSFPLFWLALSQRICLCTHSSLLLPSGLSQWSFLLVVGIRHYMALSLRCKHCAPRTTSCVSVCFSVCWQDVESSRLNLPALFQPQSLAMGVPLLLCQLWPFFVNFNSGATMCRGMPHKPSQFVDSQASLSVCLVRLLPRTTPFLVMHRTALVRSWWPTQIHWVMRLAQELTPSRPIYENKLSLQIAPLAFTIFDQFSSFQSSFRLRHSSFCSWVALQNEEANWVMDCHLRYAHFSVLFSGNSKSSTRSFHFSHIHFHTTVGHVITLRWSLRNHLHFHTCVNHCILECIRARFIIEIQMILRKTRSLMTPTRHEMEYAVGPFRSQHVASVWPYQLSRQIRIGNVSSFSYVRKPWSKAKIGLVLSLSSSSNSSIWCCPPTPRPSTQAAHQHVLNLHVLVSLSARWILRIRSDSGNFCLRSSSSSSFFKSTSARDSFTGSMSSPIGAASRFRVFVGLTSELICHVSRLLTVLRKTVISVFHIVGLCGLHFSNQVEHEYVVFSIDWNEFIHSMPTHQFIKKNSHSMTNFSCESESWNHRHVQGRNIVQHHTKLVYTIQRSGQTVSSFPWNCQAPPSGIHWPLEVQLNLPSPAPSGPKLNGNLLTAAPVSRFIVTHSNHFGLLVAPRSKPPGENELAEVSYVCSQPSCHTKELQSSFHSSQLWPSFHSSQLQPSFQEVSVRHVCADSWVFEIISGFAFSRPERPAFDVLPLCTLLAPLVPSDFPLGFPLFSLLLPLPGVPLLDHDLLFLPLPDDCLPVPLRPVQSRWKCAPTH